MAQEDVRLSGTFLDSAGNALANKTVTLFSEGTVTPALTTDTTDSAGEWDFTRALSDLPGRYDVQLVTGTQTYRILSRDKFQVTELQARNPTTAQSALSAYSTTDEAASLVATFGFRPAVESSGVETGAAGSDGDLGYIDFTLSNDHSTRQEWITARIAWEGVDVSDGSEDGQFNFWTMTAGTLVEELHLNGAALWPETDAGLDLGTSALGFNDLHLGSGGVINFDGGDVTLTHASNALTLAGGTFTVSGATVLNGDVTLGDAATDVITINGTVAGANAMIFEGATADAHETTLALTDPTADATINLPAMSAGTYYLPVLDTASAVAISATPGELNILDGATVVVAEVNYLDLGATAVGTAIASKAVILDSSKDYTGIRNFTVTGELDGATLDISGNADIAGTTNLDNTDIDGTLVVDGTNISLDSTTTLNIDNTNTSNGITIGTATSGVPVSIGHGTSEVTVADNLTVSGNLTVTGTTTSVDSTTINVTNAFVFEGATADAYETTLGIIDPTADATINLPAMGAGTYYLPVFAAASTTAISSTPEELNLLDGVSGLVQADLTKLAAIDATDSEIDLLDGSAKSTSSITIDDADAFIVIDGTTTKQIPASDLSAYVTAEGSMSSFQLEDDDGTEVTINNANEIKLIGSGITTNWTDTDNGTDGDPYDMTFTVDAAQTGITSVYNAALVVGYGSSHANVDFSTDNAIILDIDGTQQVKLVDGVLQPITDSDVDLGTTGVRWKDAFVDSITVTGEVDGASLDISGNADIDGTLETDNLTIGDAQGSDGQVLTSTGSGVGWEDAGGGGGNVATGSYTGDGATSQAITGVGFQVVHLVIALRKTSDSSTWAGFTNTTIIDDNAAGMVVKFVDGNASYAYINSVIALGSDGFTVDDQGGDSHPNIDGDVYNFTAWG